MDKAFSMGSMFGKFQYLMSWFKVALVPKQISMVMKRNVSVCEILHFFWEIIVICFGWNLCAIAQYLAGIFSCEFWVAFFPE